MRATTNSSTYVKGEFRVHPLIFHCEKTAQRYADALEGERVSGGGHAMIPFARVRTGAGA